MNDIRLTAKEVAEARQARVEAQAAAALDDNPFDNDDIALFEMFEKEAWSHERRITYLLTLAHAAGEADIPSSTQNQTHPDTNTEDDPYCYPGTNVLKNKFGIRDAETLRRWERRIVAQRQIEFMLRNNA